MMAMMLHTDKQQSAQSSFKIDMSVVMAILRIAGSSGRSELMRKIEQIKAYIYYHSVVFPKSSVVYCHISLHTVRFLFQFHPSCSFVLLLISKFKAGST